jgi:beta-1,4-mannosyl-glycoprotein beta-1,4-N-acetylglucosaminyltransferase
MVYDLTQYCGEDHLLKLRLETLENIVDRFIIIEGTKTHTLLDKPLYFLEQQEKFKKYLISGKLIYLHGDYCIFKNPFFNDFSARIELQKVMQKQKLNLNDIILHGDLDEIPNPKILADQIEKYSSPIMLNMKQRILCLDLEGDSTHNGTIVIDTKTLLSNALHELRNNRHKVPFTIVDNSGWHFTYCNSPLKIIEKLNSFAHASECPEKVKDINFILKCIENKTDLTGQKLKKMDLNENNFPLSILKNISEYSQFLSDYNKILT